MTRCSNHLQKDVKDGSEEIPHSHSGGPTCSCWRTSGYDPLGVRQLRQGCTAQLGSSEPSGVYRPGELQAPKKQGDGYPDEAGNRDFGSDV